MLCQCNVYIVPCRLTLYTNVFLYKSETARYCVYVKKHRESASDEYNLLQMNLLYMHSCNLIRKNLIFICQEFLLPVFFFHYPLKVRKSQKQFIVYSILPKNEQEITILSIFSLRNTQESDFLFVFWEN